MTAAVEELAARIAAGVPAAVARGITWCESGGAQADELLGVLPPRDAYVVGLTGSPGAGKSTLVNRLVQAYRAAGVTVAVVAVDPSSPITGGALLGDRVRMENAPGDRGFFFRSLASRGATGGIASATGAATRVLSAGGFEIVIVETVGAGQAEVSVMRVADTVALVLQPGAGDEMQALKAGLMEIADIYVLNKADQPGVRQLKSEVTTSVRLRGRLPWTPPIVQTVASRAEGIVELIEALAAHREHLHGDARADRAAAGLRSETVRLARAVLEAALAAEQEAVLAELDTGRLRDADAGRELARRAARRVAGG